MAARGTCRHGGPGPKKESKKKTNNVKNSGWTWLAGPSENSETVRKSVFLESRGSGLGSMHMRLTR